MLSDHASILFKVCLHKPNAVLKHVAFRKVHEIDLDSFKLDMSESDLFRNPPNDLGGLVDCYNDCLKDIVNQHAPLITKDIPVRERRPWYTDEIRAAKRLRRKLERKWIKSKLSIDEELFRAQRNTVNVLMNETRSKHYACVIGDCGADQKALFKVINDLFQKDNSTQLPECGSMERLAEEFSQFFVGKIQRIRDKLDSIPVQGEYIEAVCESKFERFTLLSEQDVMELIQKSC